jgi:hypothetical protein
MHAGFVRVQRDGAWWELESIKKVCIARHCHSLAVAGDWSESGRVSLHDSTGTIRIRLQRFKLSVLGVCSVPLAGHPYLLMATTHQNHQAYNRQESLGVAVSPSSIISCLSLAHLVPILSH